MSGFQTVTRHERPAVHGTMPRLLPLATVASPAAALRLRAVFLSNTISSSHIFSSTRTICDFEVSKRPRAADSASTASSKETIQSSQIQFRVESLRELCGEEEQ